MFTPLLIQIRPVAKTTIYVDMMLDFHFAS